MPTPATRPVRIVLFGRAGCHLCEQAQPVIAGVVAARAGEGEVSVCAVDVDTDRRLARRYGADVPVVEVDGRRVARWRVDAAELDAALHRALRRHQVATPTRSARFVNLFTRRLD